MAIEKACLAGKIALVAGATRGAGRGIARALGEAGAVVYCTGRSAAGQPKGMDRPETRRPSRCARQQHLGRRPLVDWARRFWEVDLANIRPYLDQTLISHLITSRHFAPLMVEANRGLIIEVIDGHFAGYRGQILYDLVKASLARLAYGMSMELARTGVTALSLSPGFLRSEAVLEHFGVREEKWRDAIAKDPYLCGIRNSTPRRPRSCGLGERRECSSQGGAHPLRLRSCA